jgi:hypothetical protein
MEQDLICAKGDSYQRNSSSKHERSAFYCFMYSSMMFNNNDINDLLSLIPLNRVAEHCTFELFVKCFDYFIYKRQPIISNNINHDVQKLFECDEINKIFDYSVVQEDEQYFRFLVKRLSLDKVSVSHGTFRYKFNKALCLAVAVPFDNPIPIKWLTRRYAETCGCLFDSAALEFCLESRNYVNYQTLLQGLITPPLYLEEKYRLQFEDSELFGEKVQPTTGQREFSHEEDEEQEEDQDEDEDEDEDEDLNLDFTIMVTTDILQKLETVNWRQHSKCSNEHNLIIEETVRLIDKDCFSEATFGPSRVCEVNDCDCDNSGCSFSRPDQSLVEYVLSAPLPKIADALFKFHHKKIPSKIDINHGIPILTTLFAGQGSEKEMILAVKIASRVFADSPMIKLQDCKAKTLVLIDNLLFGSGAESLDPSRFLEFIVAAGFDPTELLIRLTCRRNVVPFVSVIKLLRVIIHPGERIYDKCPNANHGRCQCWSGAGAHILQSLKYPGPATACTKVCLVEAAIHKSDKTSLQYKSWINLHQRIIKTRYLIYRDKVIEFCLALQSLELPALLTYEIIRNTIWQLDSLPMHYIWDVVTTVKHPKTFWKKV